MGGWKARQRSSFPDLTAQDFVVLLQLPFFKNSHLLWFCIVKQNILRLDASIRIPLSTSQPTVVLLKDDPLPGRWAYTLKWILSSTEGSCSLGRCSLLSRWRKYLSSKDFFCLEKKILYLTFWNWSACLPIQDDGLANRLTVFWLYFIHMWKSSHLSHLSLSRHLPSNHEFKGIFGYYI